MTTTMAVTTTLTAGVLSPEFPHLRFSDVMAMAMAMATAMAMAMAMAVGMAMAMGHRESAAGSIRW